MSASPPRRWVTLLLDELDQLVAFLRRHGDGDGQDIAQDVLTSVLHAYTTNGMDLVHGRGSLRAYLYSPASPPRRRRPATSSPDPQSSSRSTAKIILSVNS